MNDTESRLRDYLDTKAATVPSNEQGPGLFAESTPRRPLWPLLATAAAVAAVLALTVTVITHVGPDEAALAGTSAPLTNEPPKMPYTVTGTNGGGSLYDGSRTVRLPKGVSPVIGRLDDGWLTEGAGTGTESIGILKPDGKIQRFGSPRALGAVISPDHKQVAVNAFPVGGPSRIVVFDIASGAEVSSISTPSNVAGAVSWNPDGIWIDAGDPFTDKRLYVWKPSEPAAEPVEVPSGFGSSATTPASNVVVVTKEQVRREPKPGETFKPTPLRDATPHDRCFQIGTLRDGAIDVQREYCDKGIKALHPALSPDGRKVLHLTEKLVIDVATGKTTKLDVPDQLESWPHPAFEDATKVLVVSSIESNKDPQHLYRCDVTTGECKLLRTEKNDRIVLAQP